MNKYNTIYTSFALNGRKTVSKKLVKGIKKIFPNLMLFADGKKTITFVRCECSKDRDAISKEIAKYLNDNGYHFTAIYYSEAQLLKSSSTFNEQLLYKYIANTIAAVRLSKAFVFRDNINAYCVVPVTQKQFAYNSKIKRELNIF